MPTYEYEYLKCGYRFEEFHKLNRILEKGGR